MLKNRIFPPFKALDELKKLPGNRIFQQLEPV
jgi:hypothetical protein